MNPGQAVKSCITCKTSKPLDEFYPHKRVKSGLSGNCKECTKASVKAARSRNPERYREWYRLYSHRPEVKAKNKLYAQGCGKERRNKSTLEYMRRNPKKFGAQMMVRGALLCGLLHKKPCEVCGSENRVQGHHDDYSKPLEVRWLCHPHHAEHHREMRRRGLDND